MSSDTAPPPNADVALPCAGCGYDLRGSPRSGNCPECGRPTADAHRGYRVDHKHVVVRPHAQPPKVCALTGERDDLEPIEVWLHAFSRASNVLLYALLASPVTCCVLDAVVATFIVCGVFVALGVSVIAGSRRDDAVRMTFYISRRERRRLVHRQRFGMGLMAAGVVLVVVAVVRTDFEWTILVAGVLIVLGVLIAITHIKQPTASRSHFGEYWIEGCSHEYIMACNRAIAEDMQKQSAAGRNAK